MEHEISPLITELKENISSLNITKAKVQNEIINQTNKIEELSSLVLKLGGDTTQPWENEFYSKETPNGERIWKFRYKGVDIIEGGKDKGYEALHRIMSNKGVVVFFSDLYTSSFMPSKYENDPADLFDINSKVYAGQEGLKDNSKIIDPSILRTKRNYETEIKAYELKLRSGNQNVKLIKDYAGCLAGYINSCKDIPGMISYTKEKEKLSDVLSQIRYMCVDDREFDLFARSLNASMKQSTPNSADKNQKDFILAPIRQLVKRLKSKGGDDIEKLFGKDVLKIGVDSYFRPKDGLDVLWKFHEDD